MPKKEDRLEKYMIVNGKVGDTFYSNLIDRHITAIAFYYKRKIKTERVVVISSERTEKNNFKELDAKYITLVTIIK
jgi:hypothetical protein